MENHCPKPPASSSNPCSTALDAVVTIDASGRITSFNRGAERLLEHAAATVLGRTSAFGRYLVSGIATIMGTPQNVEGRRSDGTTFPCELTVTEFQARRALLRRHRPRPQRIATA